MGLKPRLRAAYHATRYCVDLPGENLILRAQRRSPLLVNWLQQQRVMRWALFTAWNPRSIFSPRNRVRQRALQALLTQQGYRSYPARNIPLASAARTRWAEESLFVPGLSLYKSRRLARRFGQAAFLAGSRRGPARLVFC